MHPLAFQKLWKKSGDKAPHLNHASYDALLQAGADLQEPEGLQYWGVISSVVRYRGHQLLHCYNFGNLTVKFPWSARLMNFGHQLPATITRSGTIRCREKGHTLLDQIVNPFLVFGCQADAAASELMEPGMLITDPGGVQSREYEIALPDGSDAPTGGGVLFYYLMKRIPFESEPADRWVAPGAPSGVPRFHMKLQLPVILEPGWPVLMLEKDRWFWGIVCR